MICHCTISQAIDCRKARVRIWIQILYLIQDKQFTQNTLKRQFPGISILRFSQTIKWSLKNSSATVLYDMKFIDTENFFYVFRNLNRLANRFYFNLSKFSSHRIFILFKRTNQTRAKCGFLHYMRKHFTKLWKSWNHEKITC